MRLLVFMITALLTLNGGAHAQNTATAESGCIIGGCSAQLCLDAENADMASTCEWREEYACYARDAICKKQVNGKCGWEQTEALKTCLVSPPKMQDIPAVPE